MKIKIIIILFSSQFSACSDFEDKGAVPPVNLNTVTAAKKLEDESRAAKEKKQSEEFSEFKGFWRRKVLGSFKEKSLEKLPESIVESYRFTWIPSFENPIAVRVWRTENKRHLTAKRRNGVGYESGRLSFEKTISLTEPQWRQLINLLEQTSFWNLPPNDIDDEPSEDSDYYVVEGNKNNRFHEVHRTTKIEEVRQIGAYLIELSGLKTNYKNH